MRAASTGLTTRRSALSRAEWATTALAAVVSSAGYLTAGHPYLARGVVGDLVGLAVLAGVGLAAGARVRHEALICLTSIAATLLLDPQWPLQLPEPLWWALFTVGLVAYLALRARICD